MTLAVLALHVAAPPVCGAAQTTDGPGPNYVLAPSALEARLSEQPFRITAFRDNRWQDDRTQRAQIRFPDGLRIEVKWAVAAPGGFAINNQPRYEVAAYELQKLFLREPDWVVPPTTMRELPHPAYLQLDTTAVPTFEGTGSVLVAIQYWLRNVEPEPEPDSVRLAEDPAYARRMAYLNLVTHLMRHVDSNPGNVLVSTAGPPRLFAVDNGVAFRSPVSPRGTLWETLHVDRLPAEAVDRLRPLTRADLEEALAVVAQFRVRDDGRLEAVRPTAKLDANRGVHRAGDVVQFGLTNLELDDLWDRIQQVLARVASGELDTF
ncbi:MAG: hypothetical protein R3314_13995 [Longimicrobiales bacterium]|nr:hypothetical protein [Longimicrobiales bacterium]